MSWATFIWSVLIGGYFVSALPQLLIGIWQRRLPPFFFVLACAGIIFVAISELLTMRTQSVELVIALLRWEQLAFFVFTVALVGFIFSYLGSGRIWLGLLVCASRTLCLVLNFIGQVNLHFQQITGLRELPFLGETVSVPIGVVSPRTHFSTLTNGLLLLFVIDACITVWRQGDRDSRRRALVIGGSIVAAMLIAQSITLLIHYHVLDSPYLTSLPFALIVLAMAFELSLDLFRAGQIAEKLRVSEVVLREFEEEMQEKRDEISRLSRISLLGEMTACIAHELNQPLAAIVNNANAGQRFLDNGEVAPQTMREILEDVAADARRANDVIRNIRNTIKKGPEVRKRFNLNEIATHVAHMMQRDARSHSCNLTTSLAEDVVPVEADPIAIQQVLINLINNAFEAMADTPANRRKVEIATEVSGDGTIRLSVRDHGPGISDEARKNMFDRFFTTKGDGLGMGLTIVRSIIEAHHGKISAENVEQGGALVYVVLPSAAGDNGLQKN